MTWRIVLVYLTGGFLVAALIVIPSDYIHSLNKAGMPYAGKHGAQLEYAVNSIIGKYRGRKIVQGANPDSLWMSALRSFQGIYYDRAMKKLPPEEPMRQEFWYSYFLGADGLSDSHIEELFQQIPPAYDALLSQPSTYPTFEEQRYALISAILTGYRLKYNKWSVFAHDLTPEKHAWKLYHAHLADMMVKYYRPLVDSPAFASEDPAVRFSFSEEVATLLLFQAASVKSDCGQTVLFEVLRDSYRLSTSLSHSATPADPMARRLFNYEIELHQKHPKQMTNLNDYLTEHCHFNLL